MHAKKTIQRTRAELLPGLSNMVRTNALVGVAAEVADNKVILSGDIEQVAALRAEDKRADLEGGSDQQ